ncbi:uncharacterized protein RJT20DRAFT_127107 [Scheffersomyces xylosifermentans]|uniref:uncharacterized protein n=1 Tax=Scheffersomyces xylosifermentans TaxID=1304137 RepID=UPI00315DA73C
MSDITLLKNKLLLVASSGAFANFSPEQVKEYNDELEHFLLVSTDSLDSIELFNLYELEFYLALISKNDIKAKSVLDRLLDQFGSNKKSQRIKLLQSLFLEATGERDQATKLLEKNPDEMLLSRRLTTFSRNNDDEKDNEDYIYNLIFYLDLQPSDLVTWAELGDEYSKIGHYDKAIFSFKEILLQDPYAYPVFYKVALNYYYNFLQEEKNLKTERKDKLVELSELLINARDNALRCIEICDVYAKSWLLIYIISTHKFNEKLSKLDSVKEIKDYLVTNERLRKLSEIKISELIPEDERANVLAQLQLK